MSKNISNIHLDILDKRRQEILQKLSPFIKDFVLGGGTALSLQLNHRKSFDFDFFSQSPIPKKLLENLSQKLTVDRVGSLFDEKLFLEQLVYFGDITNFEVIPVSDIPLPKQDEIKHYFEKLVKIYLAT